MALNLSDIQGGQASLEDILGTSLDLASLIFPGVGNNPALTAMQQRNVGRRQTAELREAEPNLGRISPTGALTSFRMPSGVQQQVSLPEIGRRQVQERFDTFEQLQQLGAEQRAEIMDFRLDLNNVQAGLAQADEVLRNAGLQSNIQLTQGLRSLSQFRQQTLGFIGAGLRRSEQQLSDIRRGNEEVLEDIDTDITERLGSLVTGVQRRADASFRQHERGLDSVSPLSPEERVALRAFYDAQAGSDIAMSAGVMHETAVEFRGKVASDLQTNLANATSYAISSSSGLLQTGIQAFGQAEAIAADLRKSHVDNLRMVGIARSELSTFAATFTDTAHRTLFDMTSQMVRPVLIFSDIMQGMFDQAWDITAFNNNVSQAEFQNRAAVISPQWQAYMLGIQGRVAEANRDVIERGQDQALIGDVIGATAEAATGFPNPTGGTP
jgi:hypothetical protein